MIAFVKGRIALKTPTYLVVETGGIGYGIHISLNTYSQVEKSETVKLLTHFHVKEDSQTLYGFFDDLERDVFVKLISVSGIGPNTAIITLSSMTAEEVRSAIIGENVEAFKKVKGVGPKTAKRIILDLKEKMMKSAPETSLTVHPANNTARDEALQALLALGFNKIATQKVLNKLLRERPDLSRAEDLIKETLKQLR